MLIGAVDVLQVLPVGLVVVQGPEHVVELLNPAGRRLLGGDVELGLPIREAVPWLDPIVADLLDRTYRDERSDHATAEPVIVGPVQDSDDPLGKVWFRVWCAPVRESGATAGVLLHALARTSADPAIERDTEPLTAERDTAHAHSVALLDLAAQLSRAATPAAIGRLAVTTAADLLGAPAASAYIPASDPGRLEMVHSRGWSAELTRISQVVVVQPGGPLSDAVLTATPVWLESAEQWRARYPEKAPMGTADGFQATVCLPLRVEDRDLGAVVFSFSRPRAFTPGEREYLLAVAALCAQAMDRVRLSVAEQTARTEVERQLRWMTFLAQASGLMEAPLSVERRLQSLADLAVPDIADWCAVHLVRDDSVEQVAVAHADPEKVAYVARLERLYPPDPDAEGGAVVVARTGVPTIFPDIPDDLLVAAAKDETHLELIRAIGMSSAVVVPLIVRGHSLGALTLVHAESGKRFDDTDLAFVQQLAGHAAVALDNARLYERQRHVAHTLQTALLPAALPAIPGLALAARYRPQSADLGDFYVGGDLYDVVAGTEPDQWAVTIGDVCGKGPAAAALTALLRHTMRAEVSHGLAPAQVLNRVNTAMLREPGTDTARFATVVHAQLRVDPTGVAISLVSAGHLPPLVLRRRRVQTVTAPGTLLGVYPDLELAEVNLRLGVGDSLVLYTDGLTEARGTDGLYGTERLATVLNSCAGRSADAIADVLLADVLDFQHGSAHDDLAILVVQAT